MDPSPLPFETGPASQIVAAARGGMSRAQDALWRAQREDGAFRNECYAGPSFTGMLLVAERYLGVLSPQDEDAAEAARYLRGQQRRDGSFVAYPLAENGDLAATCCAYAGLRSAGLSERDPAVLQALGFIQSRGGLDAADIVSRIFLVLAGLLPPGRLPALPPAFVLFPAATRWLARVLTAEIIVVLAEALALGAALQGPGEKNAIRAGLDRLVSGRVFGAVIDYLSRRQNPAGDWLGMFPSTVLGVVCLKALGVPDTDPRIAAAVAALSRWKVRGPDGMHVVPFTSEVWDTACAARVLLETGVAPDHPQVRRALDYLLAQQCKTPAPPDFQNLPAGAPTWGGWAFGQDNPMAPDCDTTAAVLWALGRSLPADAAPDAAAASTTAIRHGRSWLLAMQNPDGGWASFSYGQPSQHPGAVSAQPRSTDGVLGAVGLLLHPPLGFNDPSCAELTGRVLAALGSFGLDQTDRSMDRAIGQAVGRASAFVLGQANQDGVFWGRWMVNYLAGTACVLSGLAAAGHDLSDPLVQRAVRWLSAHQNPDGGWGETPDSYLQPERAGQGPSTPGLTALVLSALIGVGEPVGVGAGNKLCRGVRYLLATQRADGGWDDPCCSKAVQPPTVYYHDPLFPLYAGLRALYQFASYTKRSG